MKNGGTDRGFSATPCKTQRCGQPCQFLEICFLKGFVADIVGILINHTDSPVVKPHSGNTSGNLWCKILSLALGRWIVIDFFAINVVSSCAVNKPLFLPPIYGNNGDGVSLGLPRLYHIPYHFWFTRTYSAIRTSDIAKATQSRQRSLLKDHQGPSRQGIVPLVISESNLDAYYIHL